MGKGTRAELVKALGSDPQPSEKVVTWWLGIGAAIEDQGEAWSHQGSGIQEVVVGSDWYYETYPGIPREIGVVGWRTR